MSKKLTFGQVRELELFNEKFILNMQKVDASLKPAFQALKTAIININAIDITPRLTYNRIKF